MVVPDMIEDRLAALVRFVADNEGVSAARTGKQLGLSQSELLRLLAMLGTESSLGGLGLIASHEEGSRRLLRLTSDGRDWLTRNR